MAVKLINFHMDNDEQLFSNIASNNTDLKTNYAPVEKQLEDTLSTRNKHPLARFTQNIPFYKNMLSNEAHLIDLAEKQAIESKKKIHATSDYVGFSSANKAPHFNDNVVSPSSFRQKMSKEEQAKNYLNPQDDFLQQSQRNKSFLNNLLYVRNSKKILEERRNKLQSNAELEGNYPYTVTDVQKETYIPKITTKHVRFTQRGKKESFQKENSDDTYLDQVYIQSLEARLAAVINYVKNNDKYDPWHKNWEALDKAVRNKSFSFSRLDECDNDIAYTVNKGEKTKFRIRGQDKRYVPLNIYQYVMLHEAAHCANFGSWGHGEDFCDLLALLCLAAYEIGLINLKNIQKEVYLTNGQPILCQADIKAEIRRGIKQMKHEHPEMSEHYSELEKHIDRQ